MLLCWIESVCAGECMSPVDKHKMRRGVNFCTLCENPLMRTLFLASSHMSQELSFHTWAAMLYSSIRGSWSQTSTEREMSYQHFWSSACYFYLKAKPDSDRPWWSGTEEDRRWTERSWGLWTDTPAAGCDGNWGTGCCYSVETWRCQFEPGSKDTAAPEPNGYPIEREHFKCNLKPYISLIKRRHSVTE